MYSTVASHLLATTLANCDRINIRTPQRKAKYSDKTRVRLKDLKYDCVYTMRMEVYPKHQKVSQGFGNQARLKANAAWWALVFELKLLINTAKSILEAITTPVYLSDMELDRAKNSGAIAPQADSLGGCTRFERLTSQQSIVTSELITGRGAQNSAPTITDNC